MHDRTFGGTLQRLVRARLDDVLARGASAIARGRDDELHRLRIDVKRLRYNVEFVASSAPADAPVALDLLALLQERLGVLADVGTFARTYRAMLAELGGNDERRPGLLALATTAQRERERALASIRALWSDETGAYARRLTSSVSGVLESLSKPQERAAPS